ncbi:tyrosine-type recombinase/integrase [Phenylobacterium sp.]|uniref:tyrosine-type recombinase/integrase n=1 Tax=Phenylobacterium sp. TaxID=1871053 RepID=UPI00301C8A86
MAPLKGVHRVRKRNATGLAEYWYAWRGGPCILAETAAAERVLELKVAAAAGEAGRRYFEAHEDRKAAPKDTLLGWSKAWQASPEFKLRLSPRTQKDYRRALAVVEAELGDFPVAALKADGCRARLLKWRNGHADRPREADTFAGALSKLLAWARSQGLTSADPMREWPWIYQVDRSDIVWKAPELEAICREAGEDLQLAVLLAAYSGLRQGDLLRLTWSAIGDGKIIRRTSKKRRVVHIPVTTALQRVLDICRARAGALDETALAALTVLTKNGRPWKASTLNKEWQAARAAAAVKLPDVSGKRWHDLRGTFATSLHREGYEDEDVDRIMGWQRGSSEQTRASYVAGDVIAHAAIARAAKRQKQARRSLSSAA